ncbi:MAG: SMI1/KNR4 family protein, partial [Planctomycetota bacterium]
MTEEKIVKQINAAWDKIEKWFRSNAAEAIEELPSGASEEAFRSAEEKLSDRLGTPIPADVRACYLRHNGTGDFGLSPSTEEDDMAYALIPLEELVDHFDAWAGTDLPDDEVTADRGIKRQVWSDHWLPIATNGAADYHLIDLDPARGGKVGQVIEANHETLERKKLAPSLLRRLQTIGNQLRDRELKYDPDYGVHLPTGSKPLTPEQSMAQATSILASTRDLPSGAPPATGSFTEKQGFPEAAAAFGKHHFRHPPEAMGDIWRYLPTHAALWGYFYRSY